MHDEHKIELLFPKYTAHARKWFAVCIIIIIMMMTTMLNGMKILKIFDNVRQSDALDSDDKCLRHETME